MLTVAYGGARALNTGFQQLRDVVFAPVGQRALRRLASETFTHMHRLSMRYHITRKTGGLSRIVERGVKGVDFLLRFLLFSIGPLVLELLMICAVLFFVFDVWYLVVVMATILIYVAFTFRVTELARADPPRDERPGHRRQSEGHRQPAELRDGQVFRRRGP